MHMLMHCSCTCRTDVSRAVLTCFVSIKEAALATGQLEPASGRSRSGRNPNSQQQLYIRVRILPQLYKDRQSRNSTSLTCHIQLLAVLSRAEPLTPACGRVQIALSRPPNVQCTLRARRLPETNCGTQQLTICTSRHAQPACLHCTRSTKNSPTLGGAGAGSVPCEK